MSVGLVVNVYERTYRTVLSEGYMSRLVASQHHPMDEVVVVINNVSNPSDAKERAEAAVRAGDITSYAWVDDHRSRALRRAGLTMRSLGPRPYLADFGLVMPEVVRTRWLLGWDAETSIVRPQRWIADAIELLQQDRRVLHVSLHRPPRTSWDPVLEPETVEEHGHYAYSYGFSDHVFFIERSRLLAAHLRTFAPAAIVRHAPHPYTFEFRMESYQRAHGLFRATDRRLEYDTNTSPPGVLDRTGATLLDSARIRLLWQFGWTVLDRLPESTGPRFKRYPHGFPRVRR